MQLNYVTFYMLKSFAIRLVRYHTLYISATLLLMCQLYLYAQKPSKEFQVKNEGLLAVTSYLPNEYKGHAQNWSFAQDDRGVIYVGNVSGVLQYDGNEWRRLPIENYQVAKGNTGRIYTDFGYLEANHQGKLEHQSLKHLVPANYQKQADLPTRKIVITSQFIAFHKTGYLFIYKNNQMDVIALSHDFLQSVLLYKNELYMVKRGVGLMKLTYKAQQYQWKLTNGGAFFSDKNVTALLPYSHNQQLVATYKNGLYLLKNNEVEAWDISANKFLKDNQITCAISHSGKIILGTVYNGALIINQAGKAIQLVNQRNGIGSNYVHSLFLDKDQTLWLALDNGIARVETDAPFSLWNKHVGLHGALNHISDKLYKNNFYLGTSQGMFYRKYSPYINPLSDNANFKLIEATKGSVYYLLTTPEGVLCAHKHGIFLVKDSTATQLVATNSTVFSLMYLHNTNNRYVLASSGKGLLLLEKKQDTWVYKHAIKGYSSYNRYMHQDNNGSVWVTTMGGVYRLTLSSTIDQVVSQKLYATEQGLPTKIRNRVFGLRDRSLVAGTPKGVYIYNGTKDRFEPHPILTQKLGIREYILWLKEDQEQNLWLWTKKGVIFARKDSTKGYIIEREIFNKYKELFANYMAPHVIPIDAHNVLFETREGVVHYDRTLKKSFKDSFRVLIRKVSSNNEQDTIIFGGNFSEQQTHQLIYNQPSYQIHTLPYELNNLSFSFSATYFEEADKNEFQYLLEGFDKKYTAWSANNQKEYTNLPAGEYTLKVRARNIYGHISPETTYKFIIAPPWYQTLWAYILFGLMGVLIIWGIIHLNIRRLKHQRNHLETVVNERTQEIRQQNDTLEAQKTEISAQAQNLADQAEFLREANEEIVMQRDQLDQAYKNIKLLSDIGKEITSTFSLREISNIVYTHIQYLMDVEEFGIGVYSEKDDFITFESYIYMGDVLPSLMMPMSKKNRFAVHCIEHQKDIVIGDVTEEYQGYIENLDAYKEDILLSSLVCLPLVANNEVIGLISVQSSYINAYGNQQVNILRNLAIYIAIAIKNATSFSKLQFQNIQITDSIRYAQNIQQTILPSHQILSGCFKEHFVIYRPKDIVSGDFYWLVQTTHPQTQETYTFLAVIDCTGHGVPGSLMSMIGYQLLDEIVKQMRIIEPHLILNVLDELVISSLKQQVSENSDGMDIAMCRLQHKANGLVELVYSGAKRDLMIMEEDKLRVIKGDRLGIGGFFEDIVKEFTPTKLELKQGSLLYMNTDGIRDLPNPNRRSFGTKRLQGLIKKHAKLPLAEQKQIFEETFEAFRGTQDVRDDMTLVAVKL